MNSKSDIKNRYFSIKNVFSCSYSLHLSIYYRIYRKTCYKTYFYRIFVLILMASELLEIDF